MANLNKVMLIGRLTRNPELVSFSNGGRVAKLGFAVNNRVKNQQSGQWEEKPVFLDIKAFNREQGRKLADLCEQYLHKGDQAYIEGHLVMEEWNDKETGAKRTKLVVVMDDLQFLEPKADGQGQAPMSRPAAAPVRAAAPAPSAGFNGGYDDEPDSAPGGQEEEIPF